MHMRVPGEADILALWERGLARHSIDRALLLCAWTRPDLPASSLPDLPLGTINKALLRSTRNMFRAAHRCLHRLRALRHMHGNYP